MKLTKERKVYVAILGVGALALALDRVVLAPSGADASAVAQSYAVEREPAALQVPTAPRLSAVPSGRGLAHRLQTDTPNWEGSIRNAFRPSESWLPPVVVDDPQAAPHSEVEAFCRVYKLKGVNGPRSPIPGAWINGQFHKIGDTIDGWMLIEVGMDWAAFEKDGDRAKLRLGTARVPGVIWREAEASEPPESR
jgi:hypothetical protein